jgi:hypothetical protein
MRGTPKRFSGFEHFSSQIRDRKKFPLNNKEDQIRLIYPINQSDAFGIYPINRSDVFDISD